MVSEGTTGGLFLQAFATKVSADTNRHGSRLSNRHEVSQRGVSRVEVNHNIQLAGQSAVR